MSADYPRRRVLYIRHKRGEPIAEAFRLNQDEWVETLSRLADVTVIDTSFDLEKACMAVKPDFIIYESPLFQAQDLSIDNPTAHPQIPRIGFMMQDPFSPVRIEFLRMVKRLDIRRIFTHLPEALLRQSPELRACVFSVSLLFDDTIFRDYGLTKDIPISVFGGFLLPEIYPWRYDTTRLLLEHFPVLVYAHPGYQDPVPRHKFPVTGQDYARLLNRSYFALADTTRVDYVVRKHLEIPASGCVLVAPPSSALNAYGFVDGVNCLLGHGQDLAEKIAQVSDNPSLYAAIKQKGFDLVHQNFRRDQWRGILDFYETLRGLQSGEQVQQQGFYGPFIAVVDDNPNQPAIAAPTDDSAISQLLQKWEQAIHSGAPTDAAIPDWLAHMDEPFVLIAVLLLLKGEMAQARALLLAPQQMRIQKTGFAAYDPEEIAWLSLIAALTGDAELGSVTQRESASMQHLGLRRMRWLGLVLAGQASLATPPDDILQRRGDDRLSIHWTGQWPLPTWLGVVKRILRACGQGDFLSKI